MGVGGGRGCSASKYVLLKWPRSESVRYKVAILKAELDQAVATDCGVLFCQMMPATVAGLVVVVLVILA